MALAVFAAETLQRRKLVVLLAVTMVLGCVFLGIKGIEYYHKYEHGLMPLLGLPFEWHGPSAGPRRDVLRPLFPDDRRSRPAHADRPGRALGTC